MFKITSISKKYFLWIFAFLIFPISLFATGGSLKVNLKDKFNPITHEDIYSLIKAILDFVVQIGAVVVIFFIIYAGFQFVTAQGNEEKISKAKGAFFWTIIGALILLGAYTLSTIVCNTAKELGAVVNCSI